MYTRLYIKKNLVIVMKLEKLNLISMSLVLLFFVEKTSISYSDPFNKTQETLNGPTTL